MKVDGFDERLEILDYSPLLDLFLHRGKMVTYQKGAFFVSQNSLSRYIGLVVNGGFRYELHDKHGSVHVVGFSFSNDFVADYATFLQQAPSQTDAIALCNTDVYQVSYTELMNFCQENPQALETFHKGTELFLTTICNRLWAFYTKTPEERYIDLIEQCPDLFMYVSLKEIASYIGIKAETISRIRKKIAYSGKKI